jgi:hypothetical protein
MTSTNHQLVLPEGGPAADTPLDAAERSFARGAEFAHNREALKRALLDDVGDTALSLFKAAMSAPLDASWSRIGEPTSKRGATHWAAQSVPGEVRCSASSLWLGSLTGRRTDDDRIAAFKVESTKGEVHLRHWECESISMDLFQKRSGSVLLLVSGLSASLQREAVCAHSVHYGIHEIDMPFLASGAAQHVGGCMALVAQRWNGARQIFPAVRKLGSVEADLLKVIEAGMPGIPFAAYRIEVAEAHEPLWVVRVVPYNDQSATWHLDPIAYGAAANVRHEVGSLLTELEAKQHELKSRVQVTLCSRFVHKATFGEPVAMSLALRAASLSTTLAKALRKWLRFSNNSAS